MIAAALWLRGSPAVLVPAGLLAIAFCLDNGHASPAPIRSILHFLAAGVSLWLTGALAGGETLILVISIGWTTNLFNFMDGSDRLAGGMAVIDFSNYGL